MIVKLLAEHHMASLSLKSVCTYWSESTYVKILHCWKSHVATQEPNMPIAATTDIKKIGSAVAQW